MVNEKNAAKRTEFNHKTQERLMNRSALDCHVNYLQNKPQKAIFVPPPPSPEKRYFKF